MAVFLGGPARQASPGFQVRRARGCRGAGVRMDAYARAPPAHSGSLRASRNGPEARVPLLTQVGEF